MVGTENKIIFTILIVLLVSKVHCFLLDPVNNAACMTLDYTSCDCTIQWSRVLVTCKSSVMTGTSFGQGVLRSTGYFTSNRTVVFDDIILTSNNIKELDYNVFSGVENEIFHLDLSDNNLNHLPFALTKLPRLSSLDLSGNPIMSINSATMSSIGLSLTTLNIGLKHLNAWPYEMNKLNKLEKLNLHEIQFNAIPGDAFDPFKSSLTVLNVTRSMITSISSAICDISYFQTLSFMDNTQLDGNNSAAMFEPCRGNRSHVKFLFLSGSNMEKLPVLHKTIAAVDNIGIINANLQYINYDERVPDSVTRGVDLRGNNLLRIPFGLNKMYPMLRYLDVSSNQIRTVEDLDLNNLVHLNSLDLRNNPLRYIAKDAFKFNPNLSSLDISNTKLGHIPSAVINLRSLYIFKMENSGLQCDCSMAYLKSWSVNSVTFTDKCSNYNIPIKTYITQILPAC
ncbi:hypothetical protein ACF0H5_011099 [Mactra antiquata]